MSKISLRWRITLLMGALTLLACVLVTLLSIHNATDNFVVPFTGEDAYNVDVSAESALPFDNPDTPEGVQYIPDVNLQMAQKSFSLLSLLYLGLVAVGSMVAAYYIAGRAMRPISRLNREIETVDGQSLSKRITVPPTKDEIGNLSRSFNRLLERLEQDFEKEKRFSANVAHEFKTPLATIMTSAQVLRLGGEATPEEYEEYVEVSLESARRLSKVLDGLLMLGKSQEEMELEPVSIPALFQTICEELSSDYREKKISLTCDFREEALVGNQQLLYQAFFNLVENAYKYTEPEGSIHIQSLGNPRETVLRISDTGIGIPPEDVTHILEPFFRADKSRSRKIAGAGLGLSIAKEIFDRHGAVISVSGNSPKGTVVEVGFVADDC